MLRYRPRFLARNRETKVNEARLRQLKLLEEPTDARVPQELEVEVLELLAQLLIAIIPALEGDCDE